MSKMKRVKWNRGNAKHFWWHQLAPDFRIISFVKKSKVRNENDCIRVLYGGTAIIVMVHLQKAALLSSCLRKRCQAPRTNHQMAKYANTVFPPPSAESYSS